MNNSKTPTSQKIPIPLRLEPELYVKLKRHVNIKQEAKRSFSINEYLTSLIEKDLGGEKNEKK